MKKIKIGVIGVGSIAQGRHLPEIKDSEGFELVAICDINEEKLNKVGDEYGISPEYRFTNYTDLINCDEVEAVDICTPNCWHCEMSLAAVKANKPYSVEKPITMDKNEADTIANATRENNIKNMVCFSYRYVPAVRYLKKLIEEGKVGKIYHINMQYSQGWALPIANTKFVWRFDKPQTGSGTLGDLGCHAIDLVRFITSKDYTKVCSMAGTYVKEREKLDGSGIAKVEVDDYCNCLAEMDDEISVTFHFTRCALGRPNYQRMEIYGGEGTIIYDIEKDSLEVYGKNFEGQETEPKFTTIPIPQEFIKKQMQSFADIINGCEDGLSATIFDGQINQYTVDAIIESFEQGKWVKLK